MHGWWGGSWFGACPPHSHEDCDVPHPKRWWGLLDGWPMWVQGRGRLPKIGALGPPPGKHFPNDQRAHPSAGPSERSFMCVEGAQWLFPYWGLSAVERTEMATHPMPYWRPVRGLRWLT